MSLTPVYYQVTINGAAYASTGFIDNTNVEMYAQENNLYPTTLANSELKASANIRWNMVLQQISFTATPISVDNITTTGSPDQNTAPTTISFTIGYDKPDYVYADNIENTPANTPYLYGVAAITRQVARALMSSRTENALIYNPTEIAGQGGNGIGNGQNPQGLIIASIDVTAIASSVATAESLVTVTQIQI